MSCWICNRFESFVNSEEYQTAAQAKEQEIGLRALLIQKSIKPDGIGMSELLGLRALLIQKSIKPALTYNAQEARLRALLIQKSIKLFRVRT